MQSGIAVETREPVVTFAFLRLTLTVVALAGVLIFSVPQTAALAIFIAVVGLPWAAALYMLSYRATPLALSPWVAVGDIALLAGAELISPSTYAAVRFFALFVVAAHAQLQGDERGLAIAALTIVVLVPIGVLEPHGFAGDLIGFYEAIFAISALAVAVFVGRLSTTESTGRLRQRELSRRAIEAENEMRRRLAESIHDGPVQELVSLDMMLSATRSAMVHGQMDRALSSIGEAQEIAERNIRSLREEIVGLGPYAFEELTFQPAVQQCAPVWQRRFGLDVKLDLADLEMGSEICGALFGIAQEAVSNAARHGKADTVTVSLATNGSQEAIMCVLDDGEGFRGTAPLGTREVGHIGLASMRERAELIGGDLRIDSSADGTEVRVTVPLMDGRPPRRRLPF
ncbi:MAG: sensor histidine kinase [Thermoleophilaceae bacterium]